ncbi:sensor histidine kinase [Dactylosporangium sp. AC04546]|uniref:sensor histidine kinase n=1 Tax=Dactylosporangium sp. AC04546 TaxID=2862460 RepID=UPI001EDEFEA2|nr:sensor histidine kinase [Dactylosporangium sp. AC04546]WVK86068.1 sensor histidine kinase [Dactylosporangium sp. AC04546]
MNRVLERTLSAGRAAVATRQWPLACAFVLGFLALQELDWASRLTLTTTLLGLSVTLPLALGRAAPGLAAAFVAAGALVTLLSGVPLTVAAIAALGGMYFVAGRRVRGRRGALLVAPFVVYALAPAGVTFADPGGGSTGTGGRAFAVTLLALTGGAVLLGSSHRARVEAARRDHDDRRIADTLLDHVARGERARIARELHDVVAHHISMIAVQAEAARLTTQGMPPEGEKRLLAIGDTARSALTEMRRLLNVLREDSGEVPTRRPQPGLRQLNELIDEARRLNGASTRLIVRGRVAPLGPGVELTAFRIVQEALTNARRHAPGAAVDVELDYGERELLLRVRDNGPGTRTADGHHAWHERRPVLVVPSSSSAAARARTVIAAEGGHGLTGMRERAAMLGGTVYAGPGPAGGFLVEVRLPVEGDDG